MSLNKDPMSKLYQREQFAKIVKLAGRDGYTNPLAKTGAASPLMASGTFIRSNLMNHLPTLTAMYRENWLVKRIIDTPAEDMTRNWYTIATGMSRKDLELLREVEAMHNIKKELTDAIRWARLYGCSLALMVIAGDGDRLETPLEPEKMIPCTFQGLMVFDRTSNLEPSDELEDDLLDPEYGLPKYYLAPIEDEYGEITRCKIHHSRFLRFVGRELPEAEMRNENYWGASELEHIYEALEQTSSTMANIAQLVFQANITTLKMSDLSDMIAAGTDENREAVYKQLCLENEIRCSFGMQLLNDGDSMENMSYNFAGLKDISEIFMTQMAGAAEIPATKLFGKSPDGMNSTGESDMRNYIDKIEALQENMLRPALERLIPVILTSFCAEVPDYLDIRFNPVRKLSAQEQLQMAKEHMDIIAEGIQNGLITPEEGRKELMAKAELTGIWTGLKENREVYQDEKQQIE